MMQYSGIAWIVTLISAVSCQQSLTPYYPPQQLLNLYEEGLPRYNYEALVQHILQDPSELDKRRQNFQFGLGKKDKTYAIGLGKRDKSFGFGLGKRSRNYEFGLGKKSDDDFTGNKRYYEFGLGKRTKDFAFGLGKRTKDFAFGLGKRAKDFAFGLGKRPASYQFGLGKRELYLDDGEKENADATDLRKRSVTGSEDEAMNDSTEGADFNSRSKREVALPEEDYEPRRTRVFSFGLGKRSDQFSPLLDGIPINDDQMNYNQPKQARSYAFGLGKRDQSYAFGLGKRSPNNNNFGFGLGKRNFQEYNPDIYNLPESDEYDPDLKRNNNDYAFGLGKRSNKQAYTFGLGKRDFLYNDDLSSVDQQVPNYVPSGYPVFKPQEFDKREGSYHFGLGKRAGSYQFGLGKRTKPQIPYFSFGKRPANAMNFGLGKRSSSLQLGTDEPYYSAHDINEYIKRAFLKQREEEMQDGNYHFGLGKRDVSTEKSFGFGLGKRTPPTSTHSHSDNNSHDTIEEEKDSIDNSES